MQKLAADEQLAAGGRPGSGKGQADVVAMPMPGPEGAAEQGLAADPAGGSGDEVGRRRMREGRRGAGGGCGRGGGGREEDAGGAEGGGRRTPVGAVLPLLTHQVVVTGSCRAAAHAPLPRPLQVARLTFDVIPSREFGLAMLRMPRWEPCLPCLPLAPSAPANSASSMPL
jgi:hypothetical protein